MAGMVAPLVLTATAIEHGTAGWAALAAMFGGAGCLVAALAGRAARRRTTVELVA